jgi:hypothetical protein
MAWLERQRRLFDRSIVSFALNAFARILTIAAQAS